MRYTIMGVMSEEQKNCHNIKIISTMFMLVLLSLNACSQTTTEVDYSGERITERTLIEIETTKAVILSQEPDESASVLPSKIVVSEISPDFSVWQVYGIV